MKVILLVVLATSIFYFVAKSMAHSLNFFFKTCRMYRKVSYITLTEDHSKMLIRHLSSRKLSLAHVKKNGRDLCDTVCRICSSRFTGWVPYVVTLLDYVPLYKCTLYSIHPLSYIKGAQA